MRLYDYVDILTDEYVVVINKYGEACELKVEDIKKEYPNNIIKKIHSEYSPSGDGSILSFVYIK